MYKYFKLDIKLIREMLGTSTEASIYSKHVIEKAKKEIANANKISKKITKSLEKYKGSEITERKEIEELKGIIRAYMQLTGKVTTLPDTVEELLEVAKDVEAEFNELVNLQSQQKATVFMKDENGNPLVSSHMVLGNLKENMKILVNNGGKIKDVLSSKVGVGEMMAMDVKAIEEFLIPSKDIIRDKDGKRVLLERPISFDRMGKRETAIALSEQLPVGTEFNCTLRIRNTSPMLQYVGGNLLIENILDMGKNNGLGAWRGSGNKGAYVFKLKELKNYKEDFNGWR